MGYAPSPGSDFALAITPTPCRGLEKVAKGGDAIDDLLDDLDDDTPVHLREQAAPTRATPAEEVGEVGVKMSGKCFPVYIGGTDCELVHLPRAHARSRAFRSLSLCTEAGAILFGTTCMVFHSCSGRMQGAPQGGPFRKKLACNSMMGPLFLCRACRRGGPATRCAAQSATSA